MILEVSSASVVGDDACTTLRSAWTSTLKGPTPTNDVIAAAYPDDVGPHECAPHQSCPELQNVLVFLVKGADVSCPNASLTVLYVMRPSPGPSNPIALTKSFLASQDPMAWAQTIASTHANDYAVRSAIAPRR